MEPLEAWRRRDAIVTEARRRTLAGLVRLNVQVEPINADAERAGLQRADLRTEVEALLGAAGLEVVGDATLFATAAGAPFLHVDVMTLPLDRSYVYSARVELWETVRLVREPETRTPAVTWSCPQVVGTVTRDNVDEVGRVVRAIVERFVAEWRAAGGSR
jgi:hypothetical protein